MKLMPVMLRLGLACAVVIGGAAGCSEYTEFRSLPNNAKLYVDNKYVGLSCQSASKIDPRSASNFDPPVGH